VGGAVSGQMLAHSGVFGAALALATLLACVLGLLTLVRERPGERLLPWTRGEASRHAREAQLHALRPLLGAALGGLFAGHSLPFAAGIILIGLGGGLFLAMAPALAVDGFGWTEADYGQVTGTASVVAAVLVATVVGWLADRFGPRRLAVAMATSAAVLVGATTLGAMSGAPLSGVFAAFVLVFICLETASKACGGAVAMRLCRPEVAASQFALYMACGNLGASMGGGLFGVLSASGGPGAALPAIAGAFLGGALLYGLARAGR
ncbi:MAG: MFS transporter, partial [Pseudomonadales bacterium]|nr:MFS transporter [Pseudomonadales bacterium]